MPSSTRSLRLAAALAAFWAVPAPAAMVEDTVAVVNGQPVLLSEYRKEVDAALEHWQHVRPDALSDQAFVAELKRRTLDQMVDNELLQQEGDRRKLKVHDKEIDKGISTVKQRSFSTDESGKPLSDAEADEALDKQLRKEGLSQAQFRERIRRQLLIQKMIDSVVRPAVKPPEEAEVRAAAEKVRFIVKGDTASVAGMPEELGQAYLGFGFQVRQATAERVRVSHILVKVSPQAPASERGKALDKIKLLKKRLDAGEDFAETARKHSDDLESALRGGDMGAYVVRGMLTPELEKAAFSTPVGEISEPVQSPYGYHLVRITEKKAAQSLGYEALKDDVAQFLMNVRIQEELEKLVKSLRAKAHIELRPPKEAAEVSGGKRGKAN